MLGRKGKLVHKDTLGKSEFAVLRELARRARGAHGTALIADLKDATGREMSVGALYTTLERLQVKGYVSSTWGEPTPERGGRRKRIFKVEAAGQAAIQRTAHHFRTDLSFNPVEA